MRRVIQRSEYEYNLILNTDYNTNGHTQWYFFSVANTRKNVEYRFNIINLLKPDSLYNVGMKPMIYSERNANNKGLGWHRDGADICYYTTNIKRKNKKPKPCRQAQCLRYMNTKLGMLCDPIGLGGSCT